MEALERVRLQHGAGAAGLEQTVHRLEAEPGEEALVPAVAGSIKLGERLPARGLFDDLADVLLVDRTRRVHLGRGFGQPHLHRDGLGCSPGSRRAAETRRELVHRALGDADERRRQIPACQASERRAIAGAPMKLPAIPITVAGAVWIEGSVVRDEDVLDHDVLAARPAHPGGEPRIDDLVLRAREQEPDQSVGPGAENGDHHPGGGVTAAGETPATGNPKAVVHRLALPARRVEAGGKERIRSAGEELLLSPLGEMAEPPVVHRPEGIAPGGRAAPAAQLPGHGVGHVEVDAQAAIAGRVADPDETGGDQVLHGLVRNLPELLGSRRALLEHRHQPRRSVKQIVSHSFRASVRMVTCATGGSPSPHRSSVCVTCQSTGSAPCSPRASKPAYGSSERSSTSGPAARIDSIGPVKCCWEPGSTDDWSACVGSTSIRMPPTSVSAGCATSTSSFRIDASAWAGAWSKK